jgi:hypothetical protein
MKVGFPDDDPCPFVFLNLLSFYFGNDTSQVNEE